MFSVTVTANADRFALAKYFEMEPHEDAAARSDPAIEASLNVALRDYTYYVSTPQTEISLELSKLRSFAQARAEGTYWDYLVRERAVARWNNNDIARGFLCIHDSVEEDLSGL